MLQQVNYGMNGIVGEGYFNSFLFNDAAGNIDKAKAANPEEFKKLLLAQAVLIQEELNELIKAIEENNVIEQVDGIGDVHVTAFGLMQMLQTKTQSECALVEICDNNLTKFISIKHPNLDEIIRLTQEKYQKEGIAVDVIHNPKYNCVLFKNKETNKILKPFGYKPVDLSRFV